MIIDAHHHFWKYDPLAFDWIGEDMVSIRKNFLPEELKETITAAGVSGVVSVQARQCLEETDWLLGTAAAHDFIRGVVGWLPLAAENIGDLLAKYATNPWLKGLRHVVQDEPDPEFILGDMFNRGVSLLEKYGLVYDILVFSRQLPAAVRFADLHPDQPMVLDHIAKPLIKSGEICGWSRQLRELAKREQVSCKISGMVTEADLKHWTPEQLKPYLEIVLEAFGPSRLMFGSDWPVCLTATDYCGWLEVVRKALSNLTPEEKEQIFSGNALRIYHL
ncbi:MAG: amidohydrolase [Mangrovibacterium sp.]